MYQNCTTGQLQLALQYELTVPADHIVNLINDFVNSLPVEALTAAGGHNSRTGRPAVHPSVLLKAILYGYSRRQFSGRKIELMMKENLPMMWLVQQQIFSYHTINSFITSPKTGELLKRIFIQFTGQLRDLGLISSDALFIDGTKIEANANKYSFVWRRATTKFQQKLEDKLGQFYDELMANDIKPAIEREEAKTMAGAAKMSTALEQKLDTLDAKIDHEPRVIKGGSANKRKRRTVRKLARKLKQDYLPRLKKYHDQMATFGNRNSYSKTDPEATFMRMKEDPMLNGQLKAGYNVQIATNNQYTLAYDIFSNPTDTRTLVPFLRTMACRPMFKAIVADAGYGSEYNYTVIYDEFEQDALIPYNTMERELKRRYRNDPKYVDNWEYHEQDDYYIDPQGVRFDFKRYSKRQDKYGFVRNFKVYEANAFQLTEAAQKAARTEKTQRLRQIYVNGTWNYFRSMAKTALQSEAGYALYRRRKYDVEPVFARLKQNLGYRRTNQRGTQAVKNAIGLALMSLNLTRLVDWARQRR